MRFSRKYEVEVFYSRCIILQVKVVGIPRQAQSYIEYNAYDYSLCTSKYFIFDLSFLPVWYIGISSPSASSRINVPETGDVLSSSNVNRRDTRFLEPAIV